MKVKCPSCNEDIVFKEEIKYCNNCAFFLPEVFIEKVKFKVLKKIYEFEKSAVLTANLEIDTEKNIDIDIRTEILTCVEFEKNNLIKCISDKISKKYIFNQSFTPKKEGEFEINFKMMIDFIESKTRQMLISNPIIIKVKNEVKNANNVYNIGEIKAGEAGVVNISIKDTDAKITEEWIDIPFNYEIGYEDGSYIDKDTIFKFRNVETNEPEELKFFPNSYLLFGRNRASDVMIRAYPRNEENDKISLMISGEHFKLIREWGCLYLDDTSSFGTLINGAKFKHTTVIIKDSDVISPIADIEIAKNYKWLIKFERQGKRIEKINFEKI